VIPKEKIGAKSCEVLKTWHSVSISGTSQIKTVSLLMLDFFSVAVDDMACQKTGCHTGG
jgi:hypothetical protein